MVPTLVDAVGCHDVTGLGDQAPIVVLITFQGNAFDKLQQTITKQNETQKIIMNHKNLQKLRYITQ